MRIAIFGNSGSGKSTFAAMLGDGMGITPIDLDEIYWTPGEPGVPRPIAESAAELHIQLRGLERWIIEGCYEDLIATTFDLRPKLVFLDPGLPACVKHCQARPWEPHKYPSKALQDERLPALLDWVADYYARDGLMSHASHVALQRDYDGPKQTITRLNELTIFAERPSTE